MILKLRNIQLSFTDSRGETFNLLNGVNLEVKRETVTALVGGNGTGKTTLFNVISGFTDDFKGEILFDNLSLKDMAPHNISRLGIGRLFQGRQLIGPLFSDKDNIGEQKGKKKSKLLQFWNRYLARIINIWRCLTKKPRNYLMGNNDSLP